VNDMEMVAEEPILAASETPADPESLIARLRAALLAGVPWPEALLDAVRDWTVSEETIDGRRYVYLIAGEAFDWLTLAERLLGAVADLVPEEEREALIFSGRLPPGYDDDWLKRALGPTKYRLHRNYFYGITVEEALQLAFEEDVQKELLCRPWGHDPRHDETAFERIYFKRREELLARFRAENGLEQGERLDFTDLKAFTYWLFKFRLRVCDPAKVASDTNRGLARLAALDAIRERASTPEVAPPLVTIDIGAW